MSSPNLVQFGPLNSENEAEQYIPSPYPKNGPGKLVKSVKLSRGLSDFATIWSYIWVRGSGR